MKRLLRILLPTALGAVSLFAMALPASATYTSFTSLGCYGSGSSLYTGTNQITSRTDAWVNFTANPCGYAYVQGEYRAATGAYAGQWFLIGPGWNLGGGWVSSQVDNVSAARNVKHSACNAGGPCTGWSWGTTQYP